MTTPLLSPVGVFGLFEDLAPQEQLTLRRNELANLLNSYADEADLFGEMLQNAVDSVLTAIDEGRYADGTVPELLVFIGRRVQDSHYFCVADNGLGMEPDLARACTTPGKTAKKLQGKTIGHKGVGASFFVAASERFSLKTRGGSGSLTEFTVSGAFSWVRNQSSPVPTTSTAADFPQAVSQNLSLGRGTAVCYYFHKGWKPGTASHLVIVNNEQPDVEIGNWAAYLCAKTSLGQVENIAKKKIQVRFVLDRGQGTPLYQESWTFGDYDRGKRQLGYPFPHRVFQVAKDIAEIGGMTVAKRDQLRNTLQALRLRWTKDYILNSLVPALELDDDERFLVEEHLVFVDLFFAYSTNVMESVHTRLGTHAKLLRYGIRIAVDGAPQGRMMDFSLTSNQGLDRQMHAVMAFRNLTLDTGRKIPSDESVADVVRRISTRLVNYAKDYRIYMKRKEAPAPAHNLAKWREDVTTARKNSLVFRLFEALKLQAPVQVDPSSENDTIALFCGLVSAGLMRGLRVVALSGFNAYDGLIDVEVASPELCGHNDALSIRTVQAGRAGTMRVVEFKHSFASVLDDFCEKVKDPKDIDVLVCWELTSMNTPRGSMEYWYGDKVDLREVFGATHVWRDENGATDMVVIALKHVVASLLAQIENKKQEPGIGVATLASLLDADQQASV